jgi:hypothetical protein
MLLLSVPVMDEISRYIIYGWEWKTICKVINFKHSFDFEIFEIEKLYYDNLRRYKDLKRSAEENDLFKQLWL